MDARETATVLSLLRMNYPAHFKAISSSDGTMLLNFWHKELEKYGYETVCNAVSTVIRRSDFCPAISHVLEQIRIDTRGIGDISNFSQSSEKCEFCNGVGLIYYSKNVDYQGGCGALELTYSCRCSCSYNASSNLIPTYIQTFGFNPSLRQKGTEGINVIEIIGKIRKIIKGFGTI